jgi:hypothetical protein
VSRGKAKWRRGVLAVAFKRGGGVPAWGPLSRAAAACGEVTRVWHVNRGGSLLGEKEKVCGPRLAAGLAAVGPT